MHTRPSGRRVLAFTIASLLALPFATRGDDWTQWGAGSAHSNATAEISGAPFNLAPFSVPTNYATRAVSTPASADGITVFATTNRLVLGVRATDGTILWQFPTSDSVVASPAISKGRVFVPALNGTLYALRLADGAQLWQTNLGGAGYGSPTMVNDNRLIVAVGFPQKKVAMIDAATGSTVWQTASGAIVGIVNSSAAISGNLAIIGSMGGRFYGLNLASGAVQWAVDAPGFVHMSSPLISGGTAYLLPGGDSALLYAIDASTGAPKAGWPIAITDPAPPSGTITKINQAVSSPMMAGAWLLAQMRFEYTIEVDPMTGLTKTTLQEYVAGIDPSAASVKWTVALGAKDVPNPNEIPEFNLCPTPASFQSSTGTLAAVSSSVAAILRVLDPANNGNELWSGGVSDAGRSSPILANGRLFVGTDSGVLESYQSAVNRPPLPPPSGFSPANGEVVTNLHPTLSWGAGSDPEGKPLTYTVRIGTGGEVLQNWIAEMTTAPGVTQATLPSNLQEGPVYTYAVRSRDPNGAWSEWSAPQSFAVNLSASPAITVGGTGYSTIGDALAAVPPGGTIQLGKGTLRLVLPLQLPAGVSLVGASAWETLLDARGLGSGIVLSAGTGSSLVEGLAIFGAATNISAQGQGSVIRHVVIQGAAQAGLEVQAGSSASLINATLAANAVGARSLGSLDVRNAIVTGGSIGFSATGTGTLASTYNDLFANTVGYDGTTSGTSDLAQPVTFSNPGAMDYRLLSMQATTDAGDPSDDASQEPQPNGGRINMGAFGGTPFAEVSVPPVAASSAGRTCAASTSSTGSFPFIVLAASAVLFLAFIPRRLRLNRAIAGMLLLLLCLPAFGRPRRGPNTWIYNTLSSPGLFSLPGNWSFGTVPVPGDDILFDNTGLVGAGDCNIDTAATVKTMTINSTYTGTIFVSAASFTIDPVVAGAAGLTQHGGTFIATDVTLKGNFVIDDGTLDIESNFSFGGALWDVQSGTVIAGAGTLTFTGSPNAAQTFHPNPTTITVKDYTWVEDKMPAGASPAADGGDNDMSAANWITPPPAGIAPAPFAGKSYHQASFPIGEHQHYFGGATTPLDVAVGDSLYCYIWLDTNLSNLPDEIMLQWLACPTGTPNPNNNVTWEHRAYWGANNIGWGANNTPARLNAGGIPAQGVWKRLEVKASDVGLEGYSVYGMAFTLYSGWAEWDNAGKLIGGTTESTFVDEAVPAGAWTWQDGGDAWNWVTYPPGTGGLSTVGAEMGSKTHRSNLPGGEHQHYFYNATSTLSIKAGDKLFCYVYLEPAPNTPSEVMLQWNDGSWEHRAYWGTNDIGWGSNGTNSRRYMGSFGSGANQPEVGKWKRLEVDASLVGLVGSTLNGMAYTLYGAGRAAWDHAGRNGTGGTATYYNFTVAAGTTTLSNGYTLNTAGNFTVSSGATFESTSLAGDALQVSIAGNLNLDGAFTAGSTPVTVGGDLNLNSGGTLSAPSSRLTVQKRFWANAAGTFTNNSGDVMLVATGAYNMNPPVLPFYNLYINDTLEGYWKFDEGAGNPLDFSGYGHHGTLAGSSLPTYPGTPPTVNFTNTNCLSLSGSNSWVNLAAAPVKPPALSGVNGISLSAWIKPTSLGVQNVISLGSPAPTNGLLGEYYDNTLVTPFTSPPPPKGSPQGGATTNNPKVSQYDANVDFGFPTPPAADMFGNSVGNDHFMVAWTGKLNITTGGTYNFRVNTDDGARVWLNGTKIIDSWIDQAPTNRDSTVLFPAGINLLVGSSNDLRIEYYENGGGETCRFYYNGPDVGATYTIVPNSALTPAQRPRARLSITGTGQVVVEGSSDGGELLGLTSTATPVGTSSWTHIAGVLDFATKKITLYANGVSLGTISAPFNLYSTPSSSACTIGAIGSEADGKSRFFNGLIDDVRVFGRALSPQEVGAMALGNQPTSTNGISSTSESIPSSSTLTVDNNLILNSSTFNYYQAYVNVNGNWLNHGAATVSDQGAVTLGTPGGKLLSGGQHFGALKIDNGGTWVTSDRLSVNNALTIANSSTLNASAFNRPHAGSIVQSAGTTLNAPATVVLSGWSSATTTLTNSLTNLRVENPKENSLIGYWKFDEGQGPVASDLSKAPYNGKDAALSGGTTWSASTPSAPGPLFDNPYAASFDGVLGSYAKAGPLSATLGSTSTQSVALWFKYTGAGSIQNFVTLNDFSPGGGETNIGIFFAGSSRVGVRCGLTESVTSVVDAPVPTSNVWHHLVYVYDSTAVPKTKLYLDGALAASSSLTPSGISSSTNPYVYFGGSAPRRVDAPFGAPSAALIATTTGNVNFGDHSYVITFVDGSNLESTAGFFSSNVVTADTNNRQVSLTLIPVGGAGSGVVARRIYRTKAGNSGLYYFLDQINDNSTPSYTDNKADASLGAATPPAITTPVVVDPLTGYLDDVRIYNRALTATEIVALSAGRYPNANNPSMDTTSLGGNLTLTGGGTFNLDYGIFDANTSAVTVPGAANINGGTYKVGSSATGQMFTSGLTVHTSGGLDANSDTGIVKIGTSGAPGLDIKGALTTGSLVTTGTTIQASGAFFYPFTVESTATLDINALKVRNTDSLGMNIQNTPGPPTINPTILNFKKVDFRNNQGSAGSTHMTLTTSNLTLMAPGCFFDTSAVGYNIKFKGNPVGGKPKIYLEARSALLNGAGAQDRLTAEARTSDGDFNPRNGIPLEAGEDATNDGIVHWVYTASSDLVSGSDTVIGYPIAAFDWSGAPPWPYYSTYIVKRSAGVDTIYVRDQNGDAAGASYSYPLVTGSMKTAGPPVWDQEGGNKVLYVATTDGYIIKLLDNPGAKTLSFSALFTPGLAASPTVTQITSPIILDATYVYFGGVDDAVAPGNPKIFGVKRLDMSLQKRMAAASMPGVLATPSWIGAAGNATDLFLGSDAVGGPPGQAHLYKANVATSVVSPDNLDPKHHVRAPTTLINNVLHVGDDGGRMHATDTSLVTLAGWPFRDTNVARHSLPNLDAGLYPIRAQAYHEPSNDRVYFGDGDGHFYALTPGGALLSGSWPIQPSGTDSFQSSAIWFGSKIVVGNQNGKVFFIDEATASVYYTYDFGASVAVSDIAYLSSPGVFMIATSDGRIFYLWPR